MAWEVPSETFALGSVPLSFFQPTRRTANKTHSLASVRSLKRVPKNQSGCFSTSLGVSVWRRKTNFYFQEPLFRLCWEGR
jgi:hypothetical protein